MSSIYLKCIHYLSGMYVAVFRHSKINEWLLPKTSVKSPDRDLHHPVTNSGFLGLVFETVFGWQAIRQSLLMWTGSSSLHPSSAIQEFCHWRCEELNPGPFYMQGLFSTISSEPSL